MQAPTRDTPRKTVQKHPNASLATAVGTLSVLVVWAAGILKVAMSAEDGAVMATVLVSTSLFIGKHGLKGIILGIWHGFGGGSDDENE